MEAKSTSPSGEDTYPLHKVGDWDSRATPLCFRTAAYKSIVLCLVLPEKMSLRGEKQVHRAFQRSNVRGVLIQKIEKKELFIKLKRLLSQDARKKFGKNNGENLFN